jgi:thymidylate synthase (FAD)
MKVELLNTMGNDLMIVNVARVSYGKWSHELSDKDIKLLKYLKDHKHMSPFYHPKLQFRIQCPIFVERQLHKHQVGMNLQNQYEYNSISGRYVDFSDSYFDLKQLRYQSLDSKQGSSDDLLPNDNDYFMVKYNNHIRNSANLYNEMVEFGIAKEQARMILPLSLNTQFIWTGSLLAYLHLFDLRLKKDAQKETRIIVKQILDKIKETNLFTETLKAWGMYD